MRARPAFVFLVLILSYGIFGVPADAAGQSPTWNPEPLPPAAGAWMRVRSPNFIVEGDVGEKRLRELARRCEQFRDVVGGQIPDSLREVPSPVTAVAFAYGRDWSRFDRAAFEALGPGQGGPTRPTMALALEGPYESVYSLAYSVYLDLVFRRMKTRMPLWLERGLLTYYSTFSATTDGRTVRVGVPPGTDALNFMRSGRPIPLADVVAAREMPQSAGDRLTGRFNLQCWALVHYLQLGSPARAAQAKAFMARLAAGEDGVAAFNAIFTDTAKLEEELNNYIFRATYSYQEISVPAPTVKPDAYTAAPVADADLQAIRRCVKTGTPSSK